MLFLSISFFTLLTLALAAIAINITLYIINIWRLNAVKKDAIILILDTHNRPSLLVQKLLTPLLGTLQGILNTTSQPDLKVVFTKYYSKKISTKGAVTSEPLFLPHYLPYQLTKLQLFQFDYFRMLALPIRLSVNKTIINYPEAEPINTVSIKPLKKSIQEDQEKTPIKREGDLFQYKNFESSDDVRRIVWKLYAKNEELIIRTQEHEFEYAHDLLMSLNYSMKNASSETLQVAMDYYKKTSYSIFDAYAKKYPLLFVDHTKGQTIPAEREIIQNYIIALNWNHTHKDRYFDTKDSIHVIHSGMEWDDILTTIKKVNKNAVIYFIPLSNAYHSSVLKNTIRNLFLLPNSSSLLETQKIKFSKSATFKSWIKCEQNIKEILTNTKAKVIIYNSLKS